MSHPQQNEGALTIDEDGRPGKWFAEFKGGDVYICQPWPTGGTVKIKLENTEFRDLVEAWMHRLAEGGLKAIDRDIRTINAAIGDLTRDVSIDDRSRAIEIAKHVEQTILLLDQRAEILSKVVQ